jgi:hypothetical protein
MARGMGLTLLLMAASMAAAVAAPGVIGPMAGWGCSEGRPAVPARAVSPALAPTTRTLSAPLGDAACDADPGQVYRHWHHGGTRLNASCQPFAGRPAASAHGG